MAEGFVVQTTPVLGMVSWADGAVSAFDIGKAKKLNASIKASMGRNRLVIMDEGFISVSFQA